MKVRLSENALKVLEKRYLKKDEAGVVCESPAEMFERVARNVASVEDGYEKGPGRAKVEEEFLSLMCSLEFLPNSPTLMNAGRRLQQLAACFVLPVADSLDSIFETINLTAKIHQSGGGTGFSFSRLRPEGDIVGSTGGLASGPVSFMKVFNAATEAIKQGGTRRGANMGILRVDHPDIISFIKAKDDPKTLTNFNLSVAVTDEFMENAAENRPYSLINPRSGKSISEIDSGEVFEKIAASAWGSGEPGLLFIDRVNEKNPTPGLGEIEATNPCGEQPLLPYEPCNLGSINLSRMLKGTPGAMNIDRDKLERTIRTSVRFLDNVIDASRHVVPEIEEMARGNRKIGLGVMGFADMLARLGLVYGSGESIELARTLMRFISDRAWEASAELAKEKSPFPNIKRSVFDTPGRGPVRNATVTTIAPTGTLSIIADTSSGIEPFYSISLSRRVLEGTVLTEIAPAFVAVASRERFLSDELIEHLRRGGDIKDRSEVPRHVRKLFPNAFEVTTEEHLRIQAAFQESTDNAVSKTINLPESATVKDVQGAYRLAYELGLKGVTIYRDQTRKEQVLSCSDSLYC